LNTCSTSHIPLDHGIGGTLGAASLRNLLDGEGTSVADSSRQPLGSPGNVGGWFLAPPLGPSGSIDGFILLQAVGTSANVGCIICRITGRFGVSPCLESFERPSSGSNRSLEDHSLIHRSCLSRGRVVRSDSGCSVGHVRMPGNGCTVDQVIDFILEGGDLCFLMDTVLLTGHQDGTVLTMNSGNDDIIH
jgi:hypothetical protein